jgi:hypothetical protein
MIPNVRFPICSLFLSSRKIRRFVALNLWALAFGLWALGFALWALLFGPLTVFLALF